MTYYNQRQRPPLKNGVDIQLQSAFAEQNWLTVIRLADKRAKAEPQSAGNAPSYYEVVKICAETRLDGIAEKAAAAVAVDAWVRRGVVLADLESIELLEWACDEAQIGNGDCHFRETFGTLRFRWVKANPRNVQAGTGCLRECLLHWDLVNAQQIATVLDKSSNANDRRFLFWNILLTHALSLGWAATQLPEAKRKIYGMLAQKQLEKAAEQAETKGLNAGAATVPSNDRSLRDEEEFLLYFRVLAAHGTTDNYVQRAMNTNAGVAKQFSTAGRKQLFYEVLSQLEMQRQWGVVFDLCRQALSTSENGDDDSRPLTLACDLRLWNTIIKASEKQTDVEKAFDEVQALLNRFITVDPKLPQLYNKNVSLALLQTTFSLPSSLVPEPARGQPSLHVEQLLVFIEANIDKSSVFGDVKKFVEKLTFGDAKDLLDRLAASESRGNETKSMLQAVLIFKLRYLLATCPETRCARSLLGGMQDGASLSGHNFFEIACKFCLKAAPKGYGCTHCLQDIATSSLRLHRKLTSDSNFVQCIPKLDKDPGIDLSLVAVSSLLRLAGIHRPFGRGEGQPWLHGIDSTRLLQAALVLDAQQRLTPDDIPVRLLLIRVSFILGSASYALKLWKPLGVKRTILDALGPLFYDRLSTISPGLFVGGKSLLEPLRQYFNTVLRYPSAVKIWDAFSSGSYSSILDMAVFNDSLKYSCTRVMTVVEERRAARAFGAKMEDTEDLPIFSQISNDVSLVNATDYGSLPNLESSNETRLGEAVSLGPGLSNVRMHLGLLAERFLDLVNFKPAKEYKPAKPSEASARDKLFLLESFTVLQASFDGFLHRQPPSNIQRQLTPGEWTYYTIVSALASFLAFCLAGNNSSAPESAPSPLIFSLLTETVTTAISGLRRSVLPKDKTSPVVPLQTFTDIHGLAMLRESVMAVKQTAAFVGAFQDREIARDRSGKSGLPKEALAEARIYKTLAAQVLADIKIYIKVAKDTLGTSSGLPQTVRTASGGGEDEVDGRELSKAVLDAVGGLVAVEDWVGHLLDDWRDTITGWGQVQLE